MTLLLVGLALAQDYAFPTTAAHHEFFVPTAYKDHGGLDWNCGTKRYNNHTGNDFGAGSWDGMDAGRDLTASAPGLVTFTLDGEADRCTSGDCGSNTKGNQVWVRHPDGKETVYAHMKIWSVAVQVGDWVECGQLLGQMGSSGWSTGPHIHFAVWSLSGTWHDPFWGDCSSPPSYWVDQGEYNDLPAITCDDPVPACAPVADLACGEVANGPNDGAGSTDQTVFYGCDTDLADTGSERSWTFKTDRDEAVVVQLTGLSADLDLYVLESAACDAHDCIDVSRLGSSSDEEVVFQAVAGEDYVIVVDGFKDSVSDFSLTPLCDGAWPEPLDTGVDTTPTETQTTQTDSPTQGEPVDGGKGCSCASMTSPAGVWPVVWAMGLLRRRRMVVSAVNRTRTSPSM